MKPSLVSVENAYLYQPTLEYRMVFNRLASELEATHGRVLVVASSLWYATEFLKRTPRPIEFYLTHPEQSSVFFEQAHRWAWGEVSPAKVSLEPVTDAVQGNRAIYDRIAWVEPEAGVAQAMLKLINQVAQPGAGLWIGTSNWLRRYLPAWQIKPKPAQAPLGKNMVTNLLKDSAWQVVNCTGYHSPQAVFWSLAGKLAELVHRPDWADRTNIIQRAHYVEAGNLFWTCPLVLIQARRQSA